MHSLVAEGVVLCIQIQKRVQLGGASIAAVGQLTVLSAVAEGAANARKVIFSQGAQL